MDVLELVDTLRRGLGFSYQFGQGRVLHFGPLCGVLEAAINVHGAEGLHQFGFRQGVTQLHPVRTSSITDCPRFIIFDEFLDLGHVPSQQLDPLRARGGLPELCGQEAMPPLNLQKVKLGRAGAEVGDIYESIDGGLGFSGQFR